MVSGNLILFIVLTIIFIYTLWMEYRDSKLLDVDTTNPPTNIINDSICYLQNRVSWRENFIGTYFSFVILYAVLWLLATYNGLNYHPESFPWVIFVLVVFLVFYGMSSFLSYHRTKTAYSNMKQALDQLG